MSCLQPTIILYKYTVLEWGAYWVLQYESTADYDWSIRNNYTSIHGYSAHDWSILNHRDAKDFMHAALYTRLSIAQSETNSMLIQSG